MTSESGRLTLGGIVQPLLDFAYVLLQLNDITFNVFDSLQSDLTVHGPRAERGVAPNHLLNGRKGDRIPHRRHDIARV
jgi:hypothetical protein